MRRINPSIHLSLLHPKLLVMGNEDSLGGFPVKQAVPILTSLLKNQQGVVWCDVV